MKMLMVFLVVFCLLSGMACATDATDGIWTLWDTIDKSAKGSASAINALQSMETAYGMSGAGARLTTAEKIELINGMTARPHTTAEGLRAKIWIIQNIHESMLNIYAIEGDEDQLLENTIIPGCVLVRAFPLFKECFSRFPDSPANMVSAIYMGTYAGDLSSDMGRYKIDNGEDAYSAFVQRINDFASDKDDAWKSEIMYETVDLCGFCDRVALWLESNYSTLPVGSLARIANRLTLATIKEKYQGESMQAALITADINVANWQAVVFPALEVKDIYDQLGDRSLWSMGMFSKMKATTDLHELNQAFFNAVSNYRYLSPLESLGFMIEKSAYQMNLNSFVTWMNAQVVLIDGGSEKDKNEMLGKLYYTIGDSFFSFEKTKKINAYVNSYCFFKNAQQEGLHTYNEIDNLQEIIDRWAWDDSTEQNAIKARYIAAKGTAQ